MPYSPNRVVKGAVVKANGPATREIVTYVRNDHGLLLDRTHDLAARAPKIRDLVEDLVKDVAEAALAGQPYTLTGTAGLYEQQHRLTGGLKTTGRDKLRMLGRTLLDSGAIVKAMAVGSHTPRWLDVPTGPFATGNGEFKHGYDKAH